MSRSIGSQLALRLLALFVVIMPLGLFGVQELLFRAERDFALRLAYEEADAISARMQWQRRKEIAANPGFEPPAWIDLYAEALKARVDESAEARNRAEAAPDDSDPSVAHPLATNCDWRRDPRLFLLFDRGKPYERRLSNGETAFPANSIDNFNPRWIRPSGIDLRSLWTGASAGLKARAIIFPLANTAALCLGENAEVVGVETQFSGGQFIVGRITTQDRFGNPGLLILAMALLGIFAGLVAIATWLLNRSVVGRIAAMSDILASVERGSYSGRVSLNGGREFLQLGTAINGMIQRVGAAQEYLSRVNAYVAHNLRTPVTVAQGLLEGLVSDHDPSAQRDVDEIRHQLALLQRRCSQLLKITQLEMEPETKKDSVGIDSIISGLVNDVFIYVAEDKNVDFSMEIESVSILAHEYMIDWLVDNILQNALKYSFPDTTISVRLRREPNGVIFDVANRGPEVPPGQRERIFEQGVTTGGHGFGLYLVRLIARRHGGDAWVADEVGGFRLVVRFPPELAS